MHTKKNGVISHPVNVRLFCCLFCFLLRVNALQLKRYLLTVDLMNASNKNQRMQRRPETLLLKTLAENVRFFRKEKGLSQEGLADLSSLHRTYIGSIERMEKNASLSTLSLVAKGLGVGVPDLLMPREHEKKTPE